MGILGVLLLGRSVPRLRVQPPNAPEYTVCGSANCVAALHAALMRDGHHPKSLEWLQYRSDSAQWEAELDRYRLLTPT